MEKKEITMVQLSEVSTTLNTSFLDEVNGKINNTKQSSNKSTYGEYIMSDYAMALHSHSRNNDEANRSELMVTTTFQAIQIALIRQYTPLYVGTGRSEATIRYYNLSKSLRNHIERDINEIINLYNALVDYTYTNNIEGDVCYQDIKDAIKNTKNTNNTKTIDSINLGGRNTTIITHNIYSLISNNQCVLTPLLKWKDILGKSNETKHKSKEAIKLYRNLTISEIKDILNDVDTKDDTYIDAKDSKEVILKKYAKLLNPRDIDIYDLDYTAITNAINTKLAGMQLVGITEGVLKAFISNIDTIGGSGNANNTKAYEYSYISKDKFISFFSQGKASIVKATLINLGILSIRTNYKVGVMSTLYKVNRGKIIGDETITIDALKRLAKLKLSVGFNRKTQTNMLNQLGMALEMISKNNRMFNIDGLDNFILDFNRLTFLLKILSARGVNERDYSKDDLDSLDRITTAFSKHMLAYTTKVSEGIIGTYYTDFIIDSQFESTMAELNIEYIAPFMIMTYIENDTKVIKNKLKEAKIDAAAYENEFAAKDIENGIELDDEARADRTELIRYMAGLDDVMFDVRGNKALASAERIAYHTIKDNRDRIGYMSTNEETFSKGIDYNTPIGYAKISPIKTNYPGTTNPLKNGLNN